MRVCKTGVTHPVFPLLGVLVFLGIAAAYFLSHLPTIEEVWQIAQDPVEAREARIANGTCKTHRVFFVTCEAKVSYAVDGRKYEKRISFAYLDIDSAPRSAAVIYSASDPALVTLDVAIEKIWHEVGTLALFEAVFVGLAAACLRQGMRNGRERRALLSLSGKRLSPVTVDVTEVSANGAFRTLVKYHAPGQELAKTSMGRKALPFYRDTSSHSTMAVAVTDERGETILLLDEKLERLDFSKAERSALYEARTRRAPPQAAA